MKRISLLFFAVALVICVSGVTFAIPYTDGYTDTYEISEYGTYLCANVFGPDDTISWTFNILQDWFNPKNNDTTFALGGLIFREIGQRCDWWESSAFFAGSDSFVKRIDTGGVSVTVESLIKLSRSGIGDSSITAACGDLNFVGATSTTEAIATSSQPVPEPATMLLIGTGLVSLAGATRKKILKKI